MKRDKKCAKPGSNNFAKGHLGCSLAFAILIASWVWAPNASTQQRRDPDAGGQEQIGRLIESLPVGSRVRQEMEKGARGNGIHYAWMDQMRQEGLKRALVRTEFVWRGKPTGVKVSRIVYFSDYDSDCAQISDPGRLSRFSSSGLKAALDKLAVERTVAASWPLIHKRDRTKRGIATIEFFDNEWLPPLPDSLVPAPKMPLAFGEAVGLQDVEAARSLLQSGVNPSERDRALWVALDGNNPCTVNAILKAGADVNMRDKDGATPLIAAARHGSILNAKVLLTAGADVNAKDQKGETALSIAERLNNQQLIELLRTGGARE